jgi:glycoprotein endo-alpha-1,2-mannosidase
MLQAALSTPPTLAAAVLTSALGIAVDSSGNAYVTGDTDSDDFPMARPLQAIRRGDRDAFIAKVIEAEQGVVNSRVHIFYYPWYGNPRTDGRWVHWQQNNHVPPDDIASNYFPKLGAYSSNDRAVVDQHMAWIAQAGVGVVVTSWWGQGSYEDQAVPMLLDSAAAHGLKVAFHIEPYRGRTPDSVKGDIAYIYNRYGRHPAFFRVSRPTRYGSWANPRGVFYIFNSLATPANEWRAMLDSIRGTSLDAFVLAQTSDARLIDSGHFDGLYTYDVFNVDGSFFQGVNQAVVNRGAVFAPSVGPGYIDTRAVAGSTRNKPRLNGATYDQMWQRAIASGAEWITITSFNEWHEGTQIEPAVPKSIPGFTYLNYEGAYGLRGAQAELAYIERTRQMVDLFTERRTRLGVTTHSPRRNRWVRRR